MKLENQVVSLDLATRLKELEVKQESLCSWKPDKVQLPTMSEAQRLSTQWMLFDTRPGNQDFAAFTVAELGEMLPSGFASHKYGHKWFCLMRNKKRDEEGKTEADARAKMLIYLLENKLILN